MNSTSAFALVRSKAAQLIFLYLSRRLIGAVLHAFGVRSGSRRDHSRRAKRALLHQTAELGGGRAKDVGGYAFCREIGDEPRSNVKTVLGSRYLNGRGMDDKARRAVASACVVWTGATMLNACWGMVSVIRRVSGMAIRNEVRQVFRQLPRTGRHEIDEHESEPWRRAAHRSSIASPDGPAHRPPKELGVSSGPARMRVVAAEPERVWRVAAG